MTGPAHLTAISIKEIQFLTTSLIERCPRTMMIRELVMNAIEAASQVKEGIGEVQFRAVTVTGYPSVKLGIYNDGPGMDADMLLSICNLASSGKELGLDGNFGMGAKVAALGSNKLGLRYWSCKDKTVNEVTMGFDETRQEYVILRYGKDDPDVYDVTAGAVAVAAGYPLDKEWTEVVLFGQHGEQNTVESPFDEKTSKQWIGTDLIQRFDSVPDNVVIRLMEGTNPRDSNRKFVPFHEKVAAHGQTSVETDEITGVSVRYLYDHKRDDKNHLMSVNGSITTGRIGAGIVYKDEIYEVAHGKKWGANAPAYGVTFGSQQLSVMVMLPEAYAVRPEQYRRFLNYVGGDKGTVTLDHFREVVVALMPEWFKERINDFQPKSATNSDELQRKLQEWMNQKRNAPPRNKPLVDGDVTTDKEDLPGPGLDLLGDFIVPDKVETREAPAPTTPKPAGTNERATPHSAKTFTRVAPLGTVPAKLAMSSGMAPKIMKLYEEEEVAEKDFVGKAAKFVPINNTLFVNMNYSAIGEAVHSLSTEYASSVATAEATEEIVRPAAEMAILNAVGFAVAYALVKYGQPGWTKTAIEMATSAESLSIAADGWEKGVSEIRRGLAKKLGRSTTAKAAA